MSRRVQQFMLVSLVGLVVVLTALVHFYRQLNRYNLEEHFNTNSRVIATVLRNSLEGEGLRALLAKTSGDVPDEAVIARVDEQLRQRLRWVPVVKVKIYNLDSLTVYSTDHAQIGEDASANPGVRNALQGQPLSNIVTRDRVNTFDGVIENRNLHHQYIPMRDPATDAVEGAFEIYSDISELLERIGVQEKVVLSVLAGVLGLFYVALFLVFRRTDRALNREQAKREAYLRELETIREQLETRVTERTRELESARVFLQSVIDGIADPLFVIRHDLSVSLMNRAARQMIPVGAAAGSYRHCYQISHRRDAPCQGDEHPCSFAEVVRDGRAAQVRHTHYDGRGEPVIVDVVSTPLFSDDGRLEGIIEVQHDVTELVRTQEGLQASEARLQAIMDNVPDAIFGCGQGGTIESVNESAVRLFGAAAGDLLGNTLSEFVVQGRIDPDEARGGSLREVTARRLDGSEFPADMWLGRLPTAGGTRHIAVVRDISARRQAQEELETTRQQYFHQEKMAALGQLAAGILHEVGNPIAAIAGAAAELQDASACGLRPEARCPFDDAMTRNIRLIDQQTARLANITREIADFASPRPRERELLDLNGLLQSTARLMSYDRRFRDVGLTLELDRSLPAIMGVADQLTQVFMNLLINAMDACAQVPGRDSQIIIASAHAGDAVRVTVADNGCGMSEEVTSHALEPFYTTKPVGKGTGLGLSLCDTIAHSHGGYIELDSRPGEGTRVSVVLPVDGAPAGEDAA